MVPIELVESINRILSIGILGVLLAGIVLAYDLGTGRRFAKYIERFGMWVATAVTFFASVMTLVYSDVFGVIPCGLCWFERVMMYPQVLMGVTALYFKDTLMPRYGIVLSVVGLIISSYHHFIQMGGSQFIKCPATGAGADCAKRFIFEFGFITFPLMAAILFAFLIVLYVYLLKIRTNSFRLED